MTLLREESSVPLARSWRVTTAARVFVLAMMLGQVLSAHDLEDKGITLLALAMLAGVASAIELDVVGARTPWTPVIEGVLAAALIGSNVAAQGPMFVYLAVPPVVAGIRHGVVTTVNTSLATSASVIGVWLATNRFEQSRLEAAVPWLVLGLGAGLLAAALTRSIRHLESNQAPYAAAHKLVAQLHSLSRHQPLGLDTTTVAERTLEALRQAAAAGRAALLVRLAAQPLEVLATRGAPSTGTDHELAQQVLGSSAPVLQGGLLALPLQVGEHLLGAVVLERGSAWGEHEVSSLKALVDDHAVRLDTALLFDDVRTLATSEERNRLAREIHDGVAQEVASLGYLVDAIAESSDDPVTRMAAEELRLEVSRVVSELRFSIFDLRHDVSAEGGLSGALAEYVREVSARSDLRVHLVLDEQGSPLPRRVEGEVLRIAQEAVANVRKHARAINLWVTFVTDGSSVLLRIEDDGAGNAATRSGHYGLDSMRERAERINADFSIGPRADGGTVVTVRSRAADAAPTSQPAPEATDREQRHEGDRDADEGASRR